SEPGLAGVTITLSGTNGMGNSVLQTTTTAANGSYSFTGLAPGVYTLTETPPAGYVTEGANVGTLGGTSGNAVVSGITLTSGQSGSGYNFAEYQTTSLSGIKYIDSNGNDADNSEPGLAGVTITLSGTNGMGNSVLQTTTTAANGSYSFTGLAPGVYTLTETPPAGYVTEGANVGTLGGTSGNAVVSGITLTSGQSGSGYNFAEYQTTSLSGIKYIDSNGNDVDNSEPGLAGVTITLSGTNGMGNSVLQTTTTAANGSYSFTGLAPGVYTLTETPPAGYVTEGANVGTLGGTSGNAVVSGITLTSGQSGSGYNFAEYQTSSLSGNVYLDSNANDVDNSEPGIGGVTVTLTGTNGLGNPVTLTTTSASNGTYSFTGLAPGTYTVTETQPAGYTAETANAGSLGGTAAVGVISSITVLSGNSGTNYNFGELQPVNQSLSGTVYKDITGNGLSADDTPLSGVVVELFKDVNGNGVLDSSDGSPIATYTTGASGQYSFTSVAVGNYIVAEVTPSGYVITAPAVPDYYAETVASGANITGLNFDNYNESCTSNLKCVTFKLNNNGCITTVTDLRGNTVQNETVSVTFTVPTGAAPMQYTLVSYNAPDSYFNASDASQQTEYQVATGTFGPGTYTLTVTIPCNYYQIDFVCGAAISQLGPAGSNIFYSAQNRLISADNGGLHDDVDDEAATMHFWANLGQSLIKNFGGASTNTALGTWLKTTMPNVFGGSLLGNLTNTTVAAKYMSFYNVSGQQNWAQMMATALNVYASTLSLGGTVASTYGFDVTSDGLGAAQFNVGNNGSAFGVSNSSTITVSQMLSAINSKSTNDVLYNNVASLLNQCYNELGQVNGDGGLN
ncbi:MAG: SdrD B-like domain-containing protein, partial [Tepidisphaeraceae bacterium]